MGVAIPLGFDWDKAAYAASAEIKTLFMRTGREISDEYSKLGSKMLSAFDGSGFAQQQAAMRAEMARTAAAELESARQVQRAYDDVYAARLRANEMVTKYGVGSSQAAASVGRLADAEAVATREAKSHAEAVAASSAAHDKLDSSLATTAGSAAVLSKSFNTLGLAATAGLGIVGATSVKAAGDFEASGQKLVSAADMSADQVKILQDGILKLAGTNTYSANEMSNASFELVKMGEKYRDGAGALNVMKVATQLAAIEGADLGEVIKGLTISMNDYNTPVERAADVATKLKVAVGDSGVTLQAFSGSLHSVEPIASGFHIQLEDVYAALARYTRTGTSADQATENLRNSMNSLKDVQSPAAQEMRKFGIDADDVALKLKSVQEGGRGYIGTIQYLSDAVLEKFHGQSQIATDDIVHNATALENAKRAVGELDGPLQAMAQRVLDGSLTLGEFRKEAKALNPEQYKLIQGFISNAQHIDEFSKQFKNGRSTIEDFSEAMKRITGTVAGQSVAEALFGDPERAAGTMAELDKLMKEAADPDGNIPGAREAMETFNANVKNTKESLGALGIEMGNQLLPDLKTLADGLRTAAHFMSEHQGLAHTLIDVMEQLSLAWVGWKLYSSDAAQAIKKHFFDVGVSATETAATEKVESMAAANAQVADQQRVVTSAQEANAALGAGRAGAARAGALAVEEASVAEAAAQDKVIAAAERADGKLSDILGKLKGIGSLAGMVLTPALLDKVGDDPTGGVLDTAAGASWLAGPEVGIPVTAAVGGVDWANKKIQGDDAKNAQYRDELAQHPDQKAELDKKYFGDSASATQARRQNTQQFNQNAGDSNSVVNEQVLAMLAQSGNQDAIAELQRRADSGDQAARNSLNTIPGHVDGGPIHGPGPKGKDSVLMWGAPGEHVLTAPEVDKLGGHGAVHALRSAIRGYEGGGAVGVDDVKAFAQGVGGHGYTWGGGNGDTFDTDCSGAQSTVANFISGAKGRFATLSEESALMSRGFHMGDPPPGVAAYWVGWRNGGPGGGHTAGTIVDPNGGNVNVEMGGKAGNGQYGGNAAGASGFPNRAWIALGGGDDPSKGNSSNVLGGGGGGSLGMGGAGLGSAGGGGIGSGGGGGGGMWSSLASTLTEFLLQLAMGNPMGQMAALGIGGPGGARNGNHMTRYQNSLLRAAERQEKANESIEKLQQRQDDVAKELKIAEEHLAEVKANPKSKESTRDGAQLRVDKLKHEQSSIAGKLAAGPISGPGPLGKDSQLAPVAPGEFVLTADQVGAMGGPQGVQNWLSGSMKGYEDGGAVGDGYQSRQASSGQGGSGGVDVGGGSLGMAESAGAMAINALAPGAGEGAQIGMQEANRAAKYGASLAGIGIQGLFETFALNDSVIGDPSKSWIGRLAGGLAGTHPTSQNSAGMTQQPQQPKDKQPDKSDQGSLDRGPSIGVNIEQLHAPNGDGEAIAREINRQTQQYAMNTR
ncbi:phage tail tape measure protein, family protein, core region [Mycobacteroides abscessus subsp. abscessus]|uniref:phage tail tape measure protein n=1 Tax=Mycobacteroides abscessus TaxID=36809 RepID=UPI000926BA22|nr:phage tail tape measure protein [Mycobacteroides abscessus]SIC56594.1 phage tail tape measure protein, family protein, core region [Mycobacteroides abscessus subsp. abscessus]SKU57611.1 phage tail tape measure protein, family protein, core region [Mycobacteroides abscessus subsp. abscessus]